MSLQPRARDSDFLTLLTCSRKRLEGQRHATQPYRSLHHTTCAIRLSTPPSIVLVVLGSSHKYYEVALTRLSEADCLACRKPKVELCQEDTDLTLRVKEQYQADEDAETELGWYLNTSESVTSDPHLKCMNKISSLA